jgi:hypothetical protein
MKSKCLPLTECSQNMKEYESSGQTSETLGTLVDMYLLGGFLFDQQKIFFGKNWQKSWTS